MFSQGAIILGWVSSGLTFAGFLAVLAVAIYLLVRKTK